MLKWGWDTKMTELVNLTRFGCSTLLCKINATSECYKAREFFFNIYSACVERLKFHAQLT